MKARVDRWMIQPDGSDYVMPVIVPISSSEFV